MNLLEEIQALEAWGAAVDPQPHDGLCRCLKCAPTMEERQRRITLEREETKRLNALQNEERPWPEDDEQLPF